MNRMSISFSNTSLNVVYTIYLEMLNTNDMNTISYQKNGKSEIERGTRTRNNKDGVRVKTSKS